MQIYQLDNLKTEDELKLASSCPSTLKNIQEKLIKTESHLSSIYGTTYIWTEYENEEGLICIVKHEKVYSISQENNNIINPNEFELLNVLQARILKSASMGGGNSAKELERKKMMFEINRKNQAIQERPYEKYGGRFNLIKYMKENVAEINIDPLDNSFKTSYGSSGKKLFTTIEIFEMSYSKKQKLDLIESVKKSNKK